MILNPAPRARPAFFVLTLAFAIAQPAHADDSCWNAGRTQYNCAKGSSGSLGVSAPLLGDTLDSNPANLPTVPVPFGLEFLLHDRTSPLGKPGIGFATVKGFDGLGFGVGSWSKGTFAAPDFAPHFLGPEPDKYRAYELRERFIPGIRVGTTVVLPKLFFPKFFRVSVGGSLGFGQVSGEAATQVGAVMRLGPLGAGYSENFERIARDLPRNRISVFSAGIFLGQVYASYSHALMRSPLNRTFTHTVGLRLPFKRWVAHGGWKWQRDHRGEKDNWHRAGLQRKLGKRFALGYEYGYYRYSHSLGLQVFL